MAIINRSTFELLCSSQFSHHWAKLISLPEPKMGCTWYDIRDNKTSRYLDYIASRGSFYYRLWLHLSRDIVDFEYHGSRNQTDFDNNRGMVLTMQYSLQDYSDMSREGISNYSRSLIIDPGMYYPEFPAKSWEKIISFIDCIWSIKNGKYCDFVRLNNLLPDELGTNYSFSYDYLAYYVSKMVDLSSITWIDRYIYDMIDDTGTTKSKICIFLYSMLRYYTYDDIATVMDTQDMFDTICLELTDFCHFVSSPNVTRDAFANIFYDIDSDNYLKLKYFSYFVSYPWIRPVSSWLSGGTSSLANLWLNDINFKQYTFFNCTRYGQHSWLHDLQEFCKSVRKTSNCTFECNVDMSIKSICDALTISNYVNSFIFEV